MTPYFVYLDTGTVKQVIIDRVGASVGYIHPHFGTRPSINKIPKLEKSWLDEWKLYLSNRVAQFQPNWDSYDAPAPNDTSIDDAIRFLEARFAVNPGLEPIHVGASVLGGVGLTFFNEGTEVAIEFSNNGEVVITKIQEGADDVVTDTQILDSWIESKELADIVEGAVCGRDTDGNAQEQTASRSDLRALREALSSR